MKTDTHKTEEIKKINSEYPIVLSSSLSIPELLTQIETLKEQNKQLTEDFTLQSLTMKALQLFIRASTEELEAIKFMLNECYIPKQNDFINIKVSILPIRELTLSERLLILIKRYRHSIDERLQLIQALSSIESKQIKTGKTK